MAWNTRLLFLLLALLVPFGARAATTLFHVTVPSESTQLFFDESPTRQQGLDRTFDLDTDALSLQRAYHYRLRAVIENDGHHYEKRLRIRFHSGDRVEVRFYWKKRANVGVELWGKYAVTASGEGQTP